MGTSIKDIFVELGDGETPGLDFDNITRYKIYHGRKYSKKKFIYIGHVSTQDNRVNTELAIAAESSGDLYNQLTDFLIIKYNK
ncbi:hypothetical protein LCGC14_1123350 [marine sediment metagenome]|uniref:Uncharacterized protein n=1 Tax=marine sediment metagenome TaxID=412755 RepID=A0A0F9Q972_9ZZZZ